MLKPEDHYRLYRYLRSPIIDAGEGDAVSPKALKVFIPQVAWFRERYIRSLCLDTVDKKQIEAAFDMLADGGVLVTLEIEDEVIKLLRPKYKYQVIKEPPFTLIKRLSGSGGEVPYHHPSRPVNGRKKVCIVRYGAFGDHLMVTPIVEHYHREGWHVTYNCTNKGEAFYREDPRIDDLLVQEDDIISSNRFGMYAYWEKLGKHYDKIIPLSEAVEGKLLRIEGTREFRDSHMKRMADCTKNYLDHHFEMAGLPDIKGRLPVIPLSDAEREFARKEVDQVRKKLGKSFIVLWNIFGSSWHKAYPWMFDVWYLIKHNKDDIGVLAVSDQLGKFVVGTEFNGTVYNGCDKYKIRQSLSLHSAVDAVVTTETWSMTAGAAFDAPMVILLSHSDAKNVTYRDKDILLAPSIKDCPCYPCHQLHYSRSSCPRGNLNKEATLCMDSIAPGTVYQSLMKLRREHGHYVSLA